MEKKIGIPVIDLFAGPGGLCEGFASLVTGESREFDIRVSIEKDPVAHRTLSLRALFRSFPIGKVPESYYRYVRGEISRLELEIDPAVKPYVQKATIFPVPASFKIEPNRMRLPL